MNLQRYRHDYETLLEQAGRLLGDRPRPVRLDWQVRQLLDRRLRCVGRFGFGGEDPLIWIDAGRPGHDLSIGVELHRLDTDGEPLDMVCVVPPRVTRLPQFWAVAAHAYRRWYRFIRGLLRQERDQQVAPLMADQDRRRLWNNTIGFLRRDHRAMRHFSIPVKRGVLLTGEPGNGKTMACRWLCAQCERFGLDWESVTLEDYEAARRDGECSDLFQTERPGIILFDDFDIALRDRRQSEATRDQSTFLAELDGIRCRTGVVYLFTTNLQPREIDAALRRPGRIDQFIHFPRPSAALRERLIRDRWHAEILSELFIPEVVDQTEGLSYAEIEELRKTVAIHYIDTGTIDWPRARRAFATRVELDRPAPPIGFRPQSWDPSTPPATTPVPVLEADARRG